VKTDDEIITFSKSVPGYYEEDELRRLLKLVKALPDNAIIVEIGVEYGRSASIYFQESMRRKHRFNPFLVDCWNTNQSPEARRYLLEIVAKGHLFHPRWMKSSAAILEMPPYPLDLLHVDGEHTSPAIDFDVRRYSELVKAHSGVVVAHDYRRRGADPSAGSVFPDVDRAVDQYLCEPLWEDLGTVNTQAARRKR
jgi:hypothetical protein